MADDDAAASAVGELPSAALVNLLASSQIRRAHRRCGDGRGAGRGGGLGERVRGAEQVLAVEVLLLRLVGGSGKLELVAVVVAGAEAAGGGGGGERREQGAVGAAGEGAGAVVGL